MTWITAMNGLFEGHSLLYLILLVFLLIVLIAYRHWRTPIKRWLDDHLPETLSSHGLVLIGGGLLLGSLFLVIADNVRDLETTTFDNEIVWLINRFDSAFADTVMHVFTRAGDTITMVILILIVAAWSYFQRKDRFGAYVLMGLSAAEGAVAYTLKLLYDRSRPGLIDKLTELHTMSFPSGHSMGAAAIYGIFGLLLVRWYPRSEPAVTVLVPLWVLMIGISRIYLGAHWPTDVLAGFTLGTAFVIIASALLLRQRRKSEQLQEGG